MYVGGRWGVHVCRGEVGGVFCSPVYQRGKRMHEERGSHDDEEVTLLHVLLGTADKPVRESLPKEYNV